MQLFAKAGDSADVQGQIFDLVGNYIYAVLVLIALWGLYLVVVVWRRVTASLTVLRLPCEALSAR